MVNAINTPAACIAMARFTFVCACDVRTTFAGCFHAVVTTDAIARYPNMIKPTCDNKTYARWIVASIASGAGCNMAWPLTDCY